MFGSALGQTQPTASPFGASTATGNQTQAGGGLFGSLNQNNQQAQQAQTGGLFGNLGQSVQIQSINPLGQTAQQPQNTFGGLGQSTQQKSFFGGFGQSQQQQQPQQQNALQTTAFSQSQQNLGQSQVGNPVWQPSSEPANREKSVQDQMKVILEKWDTGNPNCAFKYYFYNKIPDPRQAPYYGPSANEDPEAWEEALSKKPGPGYIPVLCCGFAQMGERIKNQQQNLAIYNSRLHEINADLSQMLENHDTKISIRAMDAKRKHYVLKQRCIILAQKVQVLRSRGYALSGDEEDLRTKLQGLEKGVNDPGLAARGEEIWARMISVQDRARLLKTQLEQSGQDSSPGLFDEQMEKRAKKILEDYQTQLLHLKKELDQIQQAYVEWEKEEGSSSSSTQPR